VFPYGRSRAVNEFGQVLPTVLYPNVSNRQLWVFLTPQRGKTPQILFPHLGPSLCVVWIAAQPSCPLRCLRWRLICKETVVGRAATTSSITTTTTASLASPAVRGWLPPSFPSRVAWQLFLRAATLSWVLLPAASEPSLFPNSLAARKEEVTHDGSSHQAFPPVDSANSLLRERRFRIAMYYIRAGPAP
jgi:hypothetical protein